MGVGGRMLRACPQSCRCPVRMAGPGALDPSGACSASSQASRDKDWHQLCPSKVLVCVGPGSALASPQFVTSRKGLWVK